MLKGSRTKKSERIYLAGSFLGWRDEVREMLPGFSFADPRNNRQDAIAKLVEDDMKGAEKCGIFFGYKLGTASYAELGAARANGNCIVIVDEGNKYPSIVDEAASVKFSELEKAVDFLKIGCHRKKSFKKKPKIKKIRDYREKFEGFGGGLNILFTGDAEKLSGMDFSGQIKKRAMTESDLGSLEDFGSVDLTVVGFPRGTRDKKSVFFMGLSYALETPVVMIEKNPILYPPLVGMVRRIFVGKEGEKAVREYLDQLSCQDIGTEAKIMYGLFKKHRS